VVDPLSDLFTVAEALTPRELDGFLSTLSRLASTLAARRSAPAFGTCRDCRLFGASGDGAYCACMAAALDADDIDRLCASYGGPARDAQREEDRHGAA
jgi:hypothetical protein